PATSASSVRHGATKLIPPTASMTVKRITSLSMGKFYPLHPPLWLPDLLLGGQELRALPYLIHEFDAPRSLDVADERLTQAILIELHLQASRPQEALLRGALLLRARFDAVLDP